MGGTCPKQEMGGGDLLEEQARRRRPQMPLIDRSNFLPDDRLDGMHGTFTAGGWRFDCALYTRSGDLERAWTTCEALVALVVDRFDEVERAVTEWAPKLDHWTPERVTHAELIRRVLEAMSGTDEVALSVGDEGLGSAYFDGPDFVLGHAIEVVADEDG